MTFSQPEILLHMLPFSFWYWKWGGDLLLVTKQIKFYSKFAVIWQCISVRLNVPPRSSWIQVLLMFGWSNQDTVIQSVFLNRSFGNSDILNFFDGIDKWQCKLTLRIFRGGKINDTPFMIDQPTAPSIKS